MVCIEGKPRWAGTWPTLAAAEDAQRQVMEARKAGRPLPAFVRPHRSQSAADKLVEDLEAGEETAHAPIWPEWSRSSPTMGEGNPPPIAIPAPAVAAPPPRQLVAAPAPPIARPESRTRGGGAHRGRGLAGYVRIQETEVAFSIAWRWRNDARWRCGSVATREEAEALRARIREALERGEEPGPLPKYEVRKAREEAAAGAVSPEELAERRARLRAQLAPDAERCPRCRMLRPCDPCLPEIRRNLRSARRNQT